MKQDFRKPATDYAKQVAILQARGMVIDDPDKAIFYLQHLNYYRLGAYWLPFLRILLHECTQHAKPSASHSQKPFLK